MRYLLTSIWICSSWICSSPAWAQQLTLTWPTVDKAALYRIQICRDAQCRQILEDARSNVGSYVWDDAEPGVFYFRVAAIDQDGLETNFSNIAMVKAAPESPLFTSPQDGAPLKMTKGGLKLKLAWRESPHAERYHLSMEGPSGQKKWATGQTAQEVTLTKVGRHTFSVAAEVAAGLRSQVTTIGVELQSVDLSPVELFEPKDRAKLKGAVNFAWREVEHANRYVLEIGSDAQLPNPQRTTAKGPELQRELAPGVYYWRIVATGLHADSRSVSPTRMVTVAQDAAPPSVNQARRPSRNGHWLEIGGGSVYGVMSASADEVTTNIENFLADELRLNLDGETTRRLGYWVNVQRRQYTVFAQPINTAESGLLWNRRLRGQSQRETILSLGAGLGYEETLVFPRVAGNWTVPESRRLYGPSLCINLNQFWGRWRGDLGGSYLLLSGGDGGQDKGSRLRTHIGVHVVAFRRLTVGVLYQFVLRSVSFQQSEGSQTLGDLDEQTHYAALSLGMVWGRRDAG